MPVCPPLRDLHLATSIGALNKLADDRLPTGTNARIIAKAAYSLFTRAEQMFTDGDEEIAYVFYLKFFNVVKIIKKLPDYKKNQQFIDDLLGTKNCHTAIEKAEKLSVSLKTRYEEREAIEVSKKMKKLDTVEDREVTVNSDIASERCVDHVKEDITTKMLIDRSQPDGGITVQSLYNLLQDNHVSVLLMDVRSCQDYMKSHMKTTDCINVPCDCLQPGTTVGHINKNIPDESHVGWCNRSNVDYIIIFDWKCSVTKMDSHSPVSCLKDALVKWDVETVLHHEPLILEGGYEEWLLCYPALTTNANVKAPSAVNSNLTTPPLLNMIDYDVNLEFLTPPNLIEGGSDKVCNLPDSVERHTDNSEMNSEVGSTELLIGRNLPKSDVIGNKQALPTFDRSTKPVGISSSSSLTTSAVHKHLKDKSSHHSNVVVENTDTFLLDQLTRPDINPLPAHSETVNQTKKSDVNLLHSEKVPVLDRSKKPSTSNDLHEARLTKELLELDSLRNKKYTEASALADIMRKKKKVEAELNELKRHQQMMTSPRQESTIDTDGLSGGDIANSLKKMDHMPKDAHSEELERINAEEILRKGQLQYKELEEKLEEIDEKSEDQKRQTEKHKKELDEERVRLMLIEQKKREFEEEQAEKCKKELEEAKIRQVHIEQKKRELEQEKRIELQEAERKKLEIKREPRRELSPSKVHQTVDSSCSLPPNWEKRWDASRKRYYYVDHVSKNTSWEPPSGNVIYKTQLKTDEAPSSGLTRSHSSPNLAKISQETNGVLTPDRKTKPRMPASSRFLSLQTEVSAAKVRNLQPIWGSVGSGLTGLRNLGNTCYMNSTVQCLSNTTPLTIYFLTNNYIEDINRESVDGYEGHVVDEYAVLIKALWSGQYRSVVPRDFRNVCSRMNSIFAASQHQDSHDLLEYLMSGLSEGLNKVKRKPVFPQQENDNIADEVAAEIVWKQSWLIEDSIVVDLFRGQYKSTVMCQKCDKKSVMFESFMSLPLPIPSPTRCNLADCLLHFSKEEKMTGDSKWYCPQCRCKRDATKRLVIWRLPPILLVVLKRFHFEGIWRDKITAHVDFPVEGLDMSRYISGPKTRPPYNLFAISNHYGMLDSGHYTAFCRSPVTSKWYKYDDHEVSEISSTNIKTSAAYMLFYSSMKTDQFRM